MLRCKTILRKWGLLPGGVYELWFYLFGYLFDCKQNTPTILGLGYHDHYSLFPFVGKCYDPRMAFVTLAFFVEDFMALLIPSCPGTFLFLICLIIR